MTSPLDDLDRQFHRVKTAKGAGSSAGSHLPGGAPRIKLVRVALWLAAIAILGTGGALLAGRMMNGATEMAARDWKYVEDAAKFSREHGEDRLVHVNAGGIALPTTYLAFSVSDVDETLRSALIDRAEHESFEVLERRFQEASTIPVVTSADAGELPRAEPTLNHDLHEAIVNKYVDFLRLTIFDSCAEDGDVVEVLVNDESLAVVPLTSVGATIAAPIIALPTTISLRGVRDGGSGITVGIETSRGRFFCRPLQENDVAIVGQLDP